MTCQVRLPCRFIFGIPRMHTSWKSVLGMAYKSHSGTKLAYTHRWLPSICEATTFQTSHGAARITA